MKNILYYSFSIL